jgi:alcohol dehydrogenase class IV
MEMKQEIIICHHALEQQFAAHKLMRESDHVCIVKGKSSFEKSGAASILQHVFKHKMVTYFDDFSTNPKLEDVQEGIRLLSNSPADLFVAVGGGTAIDIAKLVRLFSTQKERPDRLIRGEAKIQAGELPPLVVIPTTSGSGSESTHFAVVYIDGQKYSVAQQQMLLPDTVFLDGAMTLSLPRSIAGYTGIDALGQAVESYWSIYSTEQSKRYAAGAMRLIKDHLLDSVIGRSADSRSAMLEAANLAGQAINITKTTGAHAYSYYLTSKLGLAHGHAVGLMLKAFLHFNLEISERDCNDERGVVYVRQMLQEIMNVLGCTSVDEICAFIDTILDAAGLSKTVSIYEFPGSDLSGFLSSVNIERLNNNPRAVNDMNSRNLENDLFDTLIS